MPGILLFLGFFSPLIAVVTTGPPRPSRGRSLGGHGQTPGYAFSPSLKPRGWGQEFSASLRSQGFSLGLPQAGTEVMKLQSLCQDLPSSAANSTGFPSPYEGI